VIRNNIHFMKYFTRNLWPVILILLLAGGCARSPEARRNSHLAKGARFLEQKDYSRAVIEFQNAAQAMPNDAEAYYQLGVAYVALQDFTAAVKALRKALELDPQHAASQLKMAQLMALTDDQNLISEARERLASLIERGSRSKEVLNTLAFTDLRLGDPVRAVEELQQAIAQSPGELTSAVLLALAKLKQRDPKGAEAVLVKLCADAPKSAEAHLALGEFYRSQKRFAEAEGNLQKALALNPTNGVALWAIANVALAQGRISEAEQQFKRLSSYPNFQTVYGTFLFEQGRRDEAVRELERVARENPDDRRARTSLVAAYGAVNRMADATKLLDEALKKNPKDLDALVQKGELLISIGKYADAEQNLNQVLRLKPAAPEVHYVLAKLHQARGTVLTYRQELSEALRLDPSLYPVRVELAQNLTNSKEPRAALDLLDAAPESQKSLIPVQVQRNWANWAAGNLEAMRKGIDAGLAQARTADLLLQDALWKLHKGDVAGARGAVEEVLRLDSNDLRALQVMALTYRGQKDMSASVQKIKEYAASKPNSAPVQHFLGQMLFAQGDAAAARKAFEAAQAIDPKFLAASLSLVQLDVADKRPEEARRKLEGMVANHGGNATARLWLANLQIAGGSPKAAEENLTRVLETQPRNDQALNNLAYLLAEGDTRLDEALKYAERAVEAVPDNPAYLDTLGWILYRKGVYKSAIQYFERAVSKDRENVLMKYHLAMAYAKAGDSRANATLQAALKSNPNTPEARAAREVVASSQ
jgi:tetratricopeptide (TPR) repeat protein